MNNTCSDPFETLPQYLAWRVFSYLEPKELVNTSKVSKKWNQLASAEILWKPYSYNEIFTEYDVLHSYNISKIEDARLIFLSETHDKIKTPAGKSRKLNDRFIFALAKQQPIALFLECKPSMETGQISKEKDDNFFNLVLSISSQRIKIFGWDDWDEELSEKGQHSFARQVGYQKILHEINFADDLIEEYSKKLSTKPKMLVEFDENGNLILKETPKTFFEDPNNIINSHTYFANASFFFKLIQERAVLETIKRSVFPIEPCLEFFKERMPRSVISMRKTVEKVVEMQEMGLLPKVAVFVAGGAHFKVEDKYKDTAELSLENFYKELPKHKCLVLSMKN